MCGIGVIIEASNSKSTTDKTNNTVPTTTTATTTISSSNHQLELEKVLRRRGPDSLQSTVVHPNVTMVGAVLHLRGTTITPQPVLDESGNWLLWNGEIYSCGNQSDTTYMCQLFHNTSKSIYNNSNQHATCNPDEKKFSFATLLIQHLQSVQGPYSFAWWQEKTSTLWYGRDPLGRRSLLLSKQNVRQTSIVRWTLSSTGFANSHWEAISTNGIHCIQLHPENNANHRMQIFSYPWLESNHPLHSLRSRTMATDNQQQWRDWNSEKISDELHRLLNRSVHARVANIAIPCSSSCNDNETTATIGILFSGGLDCTVLAALAHKNIPHHQPIDLINVCFDPKHASPDRQTSVLSYIDLCRLYPERNWRLVAVDVDVKQVFACREHASTLVAPRGASVGGIKSQGQFTNTSSSSSSSSSKNCTTDNMDVNIGTALWFASRGHGRIITIAEAQQLSTQFIKNVEESTNHMNRTSGGNSDGKKSKIKKETRLERKKRKKERSNANRNNKKATTNMDKNEMNSTTMTTMTMMTTMTSTTATNTSTETPLVRFIPPTTEPTEKTNDVSSNDPSALPSSSENIYFSPCRILLSGLGADEYMAGYGRHRAAYQRGGNEQLQKELCLDAGRLPERNHGRDDRCISDHGREVRYPYLDESVVSFLGSIPISYLANFNLPRGMGEKIILRNVASNIIGLKTCSILPKRALQFGSRIVRVIEKGITN
jgi:asparagine synthetase B (glutamine-hydrolysing)